MTWIFIAVLASACLLSFTIGRFVAFAGRTRNGRWEAHPCIRPEWRDMQNVKGQIWQCHCARRWRYIGYDKKNYTRVWVEVTSEMELKEALEAYEKLQ